MHYKQAYEQGVVEALEKFALLPGGGVMRAAAPAVTKGAVKKMQFAPASGHMPAGAAQARAAANPMAAAKPQGLLSKAWSGLNTVASNPVGQMGLMMGVPLAIDAMRSPERQ